jgi:hypothetical protein
MDKLLPCEVVKTMKWREFLKKLRALGATKEQAWRAWTRDDRNDNFRNDTYHVQIVKDDPHGFGDDCELWWLSIKRHDREPIVDWRDFQEIKNQLCGEGKEGIMLYPKEDRVVDTANQYHMYVFMTEGWVVPCGFTVGLKTDTADFGKAKQRSRS